MEVDGDPSCVLWRHPVLLHVPCTKDGAVPSYFPLTSLPTDTLQVIEISEDKLKLIIIILFVTFIAFVLRHKKIRSYVKIIPN